MPYRMISGGHGDHHSPKGYFDDHSEALAVATLLIASISFAQAALVGPISAQPTTETFLGPFST